MCSYRYVKATADAQYIALLGDSRNAFMVQCPLTHKAGQTEKANANYDLIH